MTDYKYRCIRNDIMVSRGARRLAEALKPEISPGELAKQLGVSRSAVAGWTKGEFVPQPAILARLEDLLGIPMRDWTEPAEAAEGAA